MDPQVRRASRVEYILTCDDGLLPAVEFFCENTSSDDSNDVLLLVKLLDEAWTDITLRRNCLPMTLGKKLKSHQQLRLWFVCRPELLPRIKILGLYYDHCFIPCV